MDERANLRSGSQSKAERAPNSYPPNERLRRNPSVRSAYRPASLLASHDTSISEHLAKSLLIPPDDVVVLSRREHRLPGLGRRNASSQTDDVSVFDTSVDLHHACKSEIDNLTQRNDRLQSSNALLKMEKNSMSEQHAVRMLQIRDTFNAQIDDTTIKSSWKELQYMVRNWASVTFGAEIVRKNKRTEAWALAFMNRTLQFHAETTALQLDYSEVKQWQFMPAFVQSLVWMMMCRHVFGHTELVPQNPFAAEYARPFQHLSTLFQQSEPKTQGESFSTEDFSREYAAYCKEVKIWRCKTAALLQQNPQRGRMIQGAVTNLLAAINEKLHPLPRELDPRRADMETFLRAAIELQATLETQRIDFRPDIFMPHDRRTSYQLPYDTVEMQQWDTGTPASDGDLVQLVVSPALVKTRDSDSTTMVKAVVLAKHRPAQQQSTVPIVTVSTPQHASDVKGQSDPSGFRRIKKRVKNLVGPGAGGEKQERMTAD